MASQPFYGGDRIKPNHAADPEARGRPEYLCHLRYLCLGCGNEAIIVIEKEASPALVRRVAVKPRGRLLSESIALAEAHAKETGFEPVMDSEFAADLDEIIRTRKPRNTSAWD